MILRSIVECPRLYSGVDRQGRPWTTLLLPRAFSEALDRLPYQQKIKTLRGLVADFRRSMEGEAHG